MSFSADSLRFLVRFLLWYLERINLKISKSASPQRILLQVEMISCFESKVLVSVLMIALKKKGGIRDNIVVTITHRSVITSSLLGCLNCSQR